MIQQQQDEAAKQSIDWYVAKYGEEGRAMAEDEVAKRKKRLTTSMQNAKQKEELLRHKIATIHVTKDDIKEGSCYTHRKTHPAAFCVGCGKPIELNQRAMRTVKGLAHAAGGKKPKDADVVKGLNCLGEVQKIVAKEQEEGIRLYVEELTAEQIHEEHAWIHRG